MALFLFASEYENGDFDAQMEKKGARGDRGCAADSEPRDED